MNRHDRRKARKLTQTQSSKNELAARLQAVTSMYEQKVLETENLRRNGLATQMALLSVLHAQGGKVDVADQDIEDVQEGTVLGWRSEEIDGGIRVSCVLAPEEESDDSDSE